MSKSVASSMGNFLPMGSVAGILSDIVTGDMISFLRIWRRKVDVLSILSKVSMLFKHESAEKNSHNVITDHNLYVLVVFMSFLAGVAVITLVTLKCRTTHE